MQLARGYSIDLSLVCSALYYVVLNTTRLVCNDTVPISDGIKGSMYMAASPPNGWHNYYERQHHHGSLSVTTPPFGRTCPLTLVTRPGQRLNLTVISMGQYGVHELDFAGTLLEISAFVFFFANTMQYIIDYNEVHSVHVYTEFIFFINHFL